MRLAQPFCPRVFCAFRITDLVRSAYRCGLQFCAWVLLWLARRATLVCFALAVRRTRATWFSSTLETGRGAQFDRAGNRNSGVQLQKPRF